MEVARKTETRLDALIGHGNFLVQVCLCAVRFVRNADNIIAVGQQFDIFAELLDGREEHASALAALQLFAQVGTALHTFDAFVTDILLGCRKQSRKLIIQIGAVGNQHNRRRLEFQRLHEQPRQEEHRKALAATRRAKIRAAPAVAMRFAGLANVFVQRPRRIILRITAQNLLLLFAAVREILEVLENIQQAFAIEHPLNHGIQAFDALGLDSPVAKFHAAPRIKIIVLGKETARPVVHAIANHAEGVIDKQLRKITAVTHRQLFVGVENRRLFAHGTLELEYHKREPVHKKNCVGNPLFGTDNFKLVYNLDDIAVGAVFRRHIGRQRHRLFIIIDTEA